MADELAVAVDAAEAAGEMLLGYFRAGVTARWKGDRDPVTAADHAAEALIRERIATAFGDDLVVGEEGERFSEDEVSRRRRWYVDPLDGTSNFLKGRHRWAVSVALCGSDDRMAVGVVHLPCTSETFTAEAGRGAFVNGRRVRVSSVSRLEETLVACGAVSYDLDGDGGRFVSVVRRAFGVRVTGSTVTDLTDVAAGRADAFWATRSGRWDLAAGALLAAEAGATVTDLAGTPIAGPAGQILAASPSVHAPLLSLLTHD